MKAERGSVAQLEECAISIGETPGSRHGRFNLLPRVRSQSATAPVAMIKLFCTNVVFLVTALAIITLLVFLKNVAFVGHFMDIVQARLLQLDIKFLIFFMFLSEFKLFN